MLYTIDVLELDSLSVILDLTTILTFTLLRAHFIFSNVAHGSKPTQEELTLVQNQSKTLLETLANVKPLVNANENSSKIFLAKFQSVEETKFLEEVRANG